MAEDFAVQVGRWCDKAGDLADAAFRAIAEEALGRVKEYTPVRTGNLRANWQVVVDGEQTAVERLGSALSTAAHIGSYVTPTPISAPLGGLHTALDLLVKGDSTLHAAETGAAIAAAEFGGHLLGAAIGTAAGGPIGGWLGGVAGGLAGSTGAGLVMGEGTQDKKGSATVPEVQVGQKIVILNPVAYARRVNYGFVGEDSRGRHYEQHGAHMVERVITEMPTLASAAVRRVTVAG